MEYAALGNMRHVLRNRNVTLNWEDPKLRWAEEVASSIRYLHRAQRFDSTTLSYTMGIVHRDIKTTNIVGIERTGESPLIVREVELTEILLARTRPRHRAPPRTRETARRCDVCGQDHGLWRVCGSRSVFHSCLQGELSTLNSLYSSHSRRSATWNRGNAKIRRSRSDEGSQLRQQGGCLLVRDCAVRACNKKEALLRLGANSTVSVSICDQTGPDQGDHARSPANGSQREHVSGVSLCHA